MSTQRPVKTKTHRNRATKKPDGFREDGVTHSGSPAVIEDYLDAREIVRRLADPSDHHRLSLAELRAKRGL